MSLVPASPTRNFGLFFLLHSKPQTIAKLVVNVNKTSGRDFVFLDCSPPPTPVGGSSTRVSPATVVLDQEQGSADPKATRPSNPSVDHADLDSFFQTTASTGTHTLKSILYKGFF